MIFNFFTFRKKAGIDIAEISRFEQFSGDKDHHFLRKTFSDDELSYCFSHKNPSSHLAGMFCAKEAVSKALGIEKYPFIEVEIKHTDSGAPYACHHGKKLPVAISISHTHTTACAVALG
jgi:holo-[acyl-carrier protein] synthase